MSWLAGAVVGPAVVVVMRRLGVNAIWPYAMVGVVVWVAILESGVHATTAGVALGLLTPAPDVGGRTVLATLEPGLHPCSAFDVVQLFASPNAGIIFGAGLLGR